MATVKPDFCRVTVPGDKRGGAIHHLAGEHHSTWDRDHASALTVDPNDIVVFTCLEPAGGQITRDSTVEAVRTLDFDRIHCLTGPVAVRGAEPGDVLELEFLDFAHEGWAWTMVHPGLGLLQAEFGDAVALRIWNVGRDCRAEFKPGIRVPIEPFCGVVGLAPAEPGPHITLSPRRVGGNIDIRHLCKGSVLQLPVEVHGALLSIGDGHLAQGDGEVCGTALEAPLTAVVRVGLIKGQTLTAPAFATQGPTTGRSDGMGYVVRTAIGTDLQHGAEQAVSSMIDYLETEYGLTRLEAYILCSAAGDLKIAVPVLAEGHASVVSFHLPKSIFGG